MLMRTLATAVAAGRVGFGAGLALAPGAVAAPWIGADAKNARTQMLVRGFGVRDVALGLGGLRSLRGGGAGATRWWFAAQSVSDASDLLTTLAAGHELPRRVRIGVAALAATGAGIGCAVALADPRATAR